MILNLRCTYLRVNKIFLGIQWYLTSAYYLWLTSISHASISFFFFFSLYFPSSFLFLCTDVYLFFFFFSFFPYLFLFFFFFCAWIFSNFSVLSFKSHKLFFLKFSIRLIKPKRNHFGIKCWEKFYINGNKFQ